MSRLDDLLQNDDVAEGAKDELRDASHVARDLASIAAIADSPDGQVLMEMLREDCRDSLVKMLNARTAGETGWQDQVISVILPSFEANFKLYNSLKSAARDAEDAEQAIEDRMDELLEDSLQ